MSFCRMVFPSTLEARIQVENQIVEFLDRCGCTDDEELFSIKLALEESLVNAIRHGNKLDTSKKVIVSYGFEGDNLKIEVEDEGSGFDYDHLPDPTDPQNIERPHGRGVMLMRHYMDTVHFNGIGNAVTLVKKMSCNNTRTAK